MNAAHAKSRDPHGRRLPWVVWLATGWGFGFSPVMPGTVGMLWGLPLVWGLAELTTGRRWCVIVLLIAVGVPLCTRAARQLSGGKDPGSIVWDEIASLPLVFAGSDPRHVGWLLTGFLLHRVFDISKPPPVRQAEHLPEGLGIMVDDLVAAGYAWLVMQVLRYVVG